MNGLYLPLLPAAAQAPQNGKPLPNRTARKSPEALNARIERAAAHALPWALGGFLTMSTITKLLNADALDEVGEFVKEVRSRKTGAVIATIRRLPNGLVAADMEAGGKKYRLVGLAPGGES
jgi:hypothetical protein